MMNAVHSRRHDHVVEKTLQAKRQPPVGMMKKTRGFENDFEDEIDERRDSERGNENHAERNGKQDFSKVKTRRRGHVEIEIGVMHIVEAPKKRNKMIGVMPPVIRPIHEKKGGAGGHEAGNWNPM